MDEAEVYHIIFSKLKFLKLFGVFGNLCDKQDMWGCFGGSTTKTPPHLPLTTVIPREPLFDLNCKVCDNQTIR